MLNFPPNFQANVSSSEYHRMLAVYQQSVKQTEALKELREHFDTHMENTQEFEDLVLYSGQLFGIGRNWRFYLWFFVKLQQVISFFLK